MSAFLIGLSWCDPEEVAACRRVGLDGDARCSTGVFVDANTAEEALSWGKEVANKFMEFLFQDKNYTQEALEVFCWAEENPEQSSWKHCLGFFQRVSVAQFPDFHRMTAEAYSEWCKKTGVS